MTSQRTKSTGVVPSVGCEPSIGGADGNFEADMQHGKST
jgi:hypothetical protein